MPVPPPEQKGADGNRTRASRFCRPQRYHFATAPYRTIYFILVHFNLQKRSGVFLTSYIFILFLLALRLFQLRLLVVPFLHSSALRSQPLAAKALCDSIPSDAL